MELKYFEFEVFWYTSWNLRHNSTPQNRLVRWWLSPLYKLLSRVLFIWCETWVFPNTPLSRPALFGLGAWIGRWPLNPTSYGTMLKFGRNSTPQNQLVRSWLPPLYNLLFVDVVSLILAYLSLIHFFFICNYIVYLFLVCLLIS